MRKRFRFLLAVWRGALVLGWFVSSAAAAEVHDISVPTPSALNREVVFAYRMPTATGTSAARGVLLLVPGCNGSGRAFLEPEGNEWTRFADRHGLALMAPTFRTDMDELRGRKGYYYPALWSGKATLDALAALKRREHVDVERVLIFGFSAGAHFAHRFALWKPERVKAFAAYSAAWWDEPTAKLAGVPGLILCGEADERFEATLAFMMKGRQLGLPLIWRSYAGTGHQLTPAVTHMAQAFLAHHAQQKPQPPGKQGTFIGDMQRYAYFPAGSDEAENIPRDLRVTLPSRAVAEAWATENPSFLQNHSDQ